MLHDEKCALWRKRLAAQQASGLTVVAWCFQQGIGVKAYYYWRKRLLTLGKPPVSTTPQWLALAPEAASTSSLTLQVGPVTITITADFDPQLLSAAIRAITGEGGKSPC